MELKLKENEEKKLDKCPICKSKLKKGKIHSEAGKIHQKVKCRDCGFEKEFVFGF